MSETDLHRAAATYLTVVLPPTVWWSTIGHGGFKLDVRTAARLKSMGLKAGVPDLMLVYDGRAYFAELKAPKGKLSPAQLDTHEKLLRAGAAPHVCRSVDDLRLSLQQWGIPTREHVRRAA